MCPGCGLTCSAEGWANDTAVREMLAAMAALPQPLPAAVLRYLSLFRPAAGAMSWTKALKLVRELVALTGPGHVQVQGQVSRPCPARIWAQAMEQMVAQRDTLKRPMKGHNYLRQVAYSLTDQGDAKQERQAEIERQKHPSFHVEKQENPACSSEVAKENLERIKQLFGGGVNSANAERA